MEIIIFEKSSSSFKKPKHLKKFVFLYISFKNEPPTSMEIDTEMIAFLPRNSKGFVTSIFWGDEINEICSQKQRFWIEVLHKSFEETVEIKKNQPLGFLDIEPENLKFKYATVSKKKKADQKKILTYKPKTKETTWRFS